MKNFFARARVYVLIASLSLLAQASRAASPAELIHTYRTATDSAVRAQAREALMKAGPDAVPALVAEMANNARGRDRMRAMIQQIGAPAAPKLLALLSNPELAPVAASALFWVVDEKSYALLPRFAECAGREDTRRGCLDAMLRVAGPKAKKHAPVVLKLLSSSDPETRAYACGTLVRLESRSKDAISALEKASQDPEPAVKQAAEDALGRLRG